MLNSIVTNYKKEEKWKVQTDLCRIMSKHGSDKGNQTDWHNYTTLYNCLFDDKFRQEATHIFEIGLGTNDVSIDSNMGVFGKPGASVYGWSEIFPNAKIYGADIDKKILFNTDRISTFYCDQTNPDSIKYMWENPELKNVEFDVIIDDALHKFKANECFLNNSFHKLKKGGYFIIEDIHNNDINSILDLLYGQYVVAELIRIPHSRNIYDNTLLIIQKQ